MRLLLALRAQRSLGVVALPVLAVAGVRVPDDEQRFGVVRRVEESVEQVGVVRVGELLRALLAVNQRRSSISEFGR